MDKYWVLYDLRAGATFVHQLAGEGQLLMGVRMDKYIGFCVIQGRALHLCML